MGAFPIQTGTSCAAEWIDHGASGAIVFLKDKEQLDFWLQKAISEDSLVNTAQVLNNSTIRARYTKSVMTSKVERLYLENLSYSSVFGKL